MEFQISEHLQIPEHLKTITVNLPSQDDNTKFHISIEEDVGRIRSFDRPTCKNEEAMEIVAINVIRKIMSSEPVKLEYRTLYSMNGILFDMSVWQCEAAACLAGHMAIELGWGEFGEVCDVAGERLKNVFYLTYLRAADILEVIERVITPDYEQQ